MILKIDILIKCILLLHRENLLRLENPDIIDSSGNLIKTILNMYKNNRKVLIATESTVVDDLKDLVLGMINTPESYDETVITQQLRVILANNEQLLNAVIETISAVTTQKGLRQSIASLRNFFNNHYKELEFNRLIMQTIAKMKNNELEGSVQEYTSNLISQLESLTLQSTARDPGVVDEMDIVDEDGVDRVFKKTKTSSDNDKRLKTGWKELNEMLNGGYRAGEMCLTSGIQHSYKSGFVRSLFAQLCMYNKPTLMDTTKKPLALFISFEDDADVIMGFMYHYLYFSENNKSPDMKNLDTKEAAKYVKDRLTRTGFNIKILRINPNEWSYIHLTNKLLGYEAQGYELQILVIDYLSKLPTIGCNKSGAIGTDIRDLFDKVRNFCTGARRTLVIVPHQLNVEVKQLLKNGISDKNLVKELAGKGYYEGSKQIDQVVDLEIHHHIAKVGDGYVLTFQRGKRRYPEVIPDSKKYFTLPFPKNDPVIPPNLDLNGDYIGFKYTLGDTASNLGLEDFQF